MALIFPFVRCGNRMSMDTDGDGVMTMSYEFCEDCGGKDYGEPVRIFEQYSIANDSPRGLHP